MIRLEGFDPKTGKPVKFTLNKGRVTKVESAHNAQETRTSEEPVVNNDVTAGDESKQ
jgi:hypothetical protein